MNPCELTVYVTALANLMCQDLSADEINLLGSVFSQLGDTLETIAAQQTICQSANSSSG